MKKSERLISRPSSWKGGADFYRERETEGFVKETAKTMQIIKFNLT